MVEQFVSDGANDSVGERVLPGRAWCGESLGRAHALHSSPELATVDAVAIAQEVAWRRVRRHRVADVTGGRGHKRHSLSGVEQVRFEDRSTTPRAR